MNSFEVYRQQIETQIASTKAKALNANQIANSTTADTLLSDLLVSNANTQQVFLTLLDQLTAGGVNNNGGDTQYVVSTVTDPALDDALTALTNAVNTAIAGLIGTQTAMNTYLQALGDLTALHNSITAQVTSATTSASNASNASYAANLAAEVATGTLEAIQQQHSQITSTAATVANDRALTLGYKNTTLGYRDEVFSALATLSTGYYPAGQWNAATNTAPPTPTEGAPVYRIVNTGTIAGVVYHEGDDIFWNGTNGWFKVDNSERFTSINGYTSGSINITYVDVGAASAAQGTKADTALQPGDLGVYVTATSLTTRLVDYVTFSSQNTTLASYATNNALTTAIGSITTSLAGKATSAQGAKADTALQPATFAYFNQVATSTIPWALANVYIPWDGFGGHYKSRELDFAHVFTDYAHDAALNIASEIHPNWKACDSVAKLLHGRNVFQILGHAMATPIEMLICWAPISGDSIKGGTRTAWELAKRYKVRRLINLVVQVDYERALQFVGLTEERLMALSGSVVKDV